MEGLKTDFPADFARGEADFPKTLARLRAGLGTEYSGFSAAILRGDRLLLRTAGGQRQTWGGREKGHPAPLPVTAATRYDMASVTKLIVTAQVALRLLEEGVITLFDPVSRFFENAGCYGEVTVRHLLTHTSGIAPHFYLSERCETPADAAKAILSSAPLCKPGEEVHYSCMGFILLQRILEKAVGERLDKSAKELVFAPLGMHTASYTPAGDDFAATEYSLRRGGYICGEVHDENARYLGGVSGNAGVFASLDDMIAFGSMLSRRGEGFLSPRTFSLAVHDYTPHLSESRGLGFSLNNYDLCSSGDLISPLSYGHNGFTGTSVYTDAATGTTVILLTNAVHYGRENREAFFRSRRIFHNLAFLESDLL